MMTPFANPSTDRAKASMNIDEQIEAIEKARSLVIATMAECDTPQIEAILRSADMELHWALWNLGAKVALRPELEYPEALA